MKLLRRLLLLTAALVALPGLLHAQVCTHYASPSGTGNGLNLSTPFQIASFWNVATPGSKLCLLNGTYTGPSGMINPPPGLSGTASAPIAISAINDGQVLIDGQQVRSPLHFENNNYWTIDGVNGRNGFFTVLSFGPNAADNIVRRACFWDAWPADANSAIIWNYGVGANRNLIEDGCAFGQARKMVANGQSLDSRFTARRVWAAWYTSSSTISGAGVFENTYASYNAIYENVIGTADADPDAVVVGVNGILANAHFDPLGSPLTSEQICSNAKYLGSIAYTLAAQNTPTGFTDLGIVDMSQYVDCNELKDVVAYAEANRGLVWLANVTALQGYPGPSGPQLFTRNTAIGTGQVMIGDSWTEFEFESGATVGAVPNVWNGSGTSGARVCYQYQDGVLTKTPLWPWPMNQRIIDAHILAGRPPVDVTATMESIFGIIPAECRTTGARFIVISPTSGNQGATLNVFVTGTNTNFVNATSALTFSGTGITVNSTTVTSPTAATVSVTIDGGATLGLRTVTMTTGPEIVTLSNGFTVAGAPTPPANLRTVFEPGIAVPRSAIASGAR